MMRAWHPSLRAPFLLAFLVLHGCAGHPDNHTLAELRDVEPDVAEVVIDDSLDKAMASYRKFLEETPTNAKTPEAMRRLADLQVEKEYGIFGGDRLARLPAPAVGAARPVELPDRAGVPVDVHSDIPPGAQSGRAIADLFENEGDFERRATAMLSPDTSSGHGVARLPGASEDTAPAGPREAIETYQRILTEYPHYERNDEVLYQMARAYDELGEPARAMEVMERLISEHRQSAYTGEVYFRRAEYFFVRKKYLDAEEAYAAVVAMGVHSDFYELSLYKLGWSFYKQEFYEDALHQYMALLDYKSSIRYDFDRQSLAELGEEEAPAAGGRSPLE